MTAELPSIQFFEGIFEELSSLSLRRNRSTGMRSVVMIFKTLKSIESFNSYRNRFAKALRLTDEEGEISIEPSGVRFIFGGPEGDTFERMECQLEIDRDDHWDRLMRFMHRYAEANGLEYSEPTPPTQ